MMFSIFLPQLPAAAHLRVAGPRVAGDELHPGADFGEGGAEEGGPRGVGEMLLLLSGRRTDTARCLKRET